MNSEVETEFDAFWAGISRLDGLCEKWTQTFGLSCCEVEVLTMLKFYGPVTQKQICKTYEIPKQTVNNFIRQLKADNFIEIVADVENKREKKIRLTAQGVAYADNLLKPHFEFHKKVAGRIGMELIRKITKELNTFADAYELELELEKVSSNWKIK